MTEPTVIREQTPRWILWTMGLLLALSIVDRIPVARAKPFGNATSMTLTASTTATAISGGRGCAQLIWNDSKEPVYVGGSNVDTTNGLAICGDPALCQVSFYAADATDGILYYVKDSSPATQAFYGISGGGC